MAGRIFMAITSRIQTSVSRLATAPATRSRRCTSSLRMWRHFRFSFCATPRLRNSGMLRSLPSKAAGTARKRSVIRSWLSIGAIIRSRKNPSSRRYAPNHATVVIGDENDALWLGGPTPDLL